MPDKLVIGMLFGCPVAPLLWVACGGSPALTTAIGFSLLLLALGSLVLTIYPGHPTAIGFLSCFFLINVGISFVFFPVDYLKIKSFVGMLFVLVLFNGAWLSSLYSSASDEY